MTRKSIIIAALVLLVAGAAAVGTYALRHRQTLPAGLIAANGRLEATEVDVAAKNAGRIATVTAEEGDLVKQGQVVAQMDMTETEASLRGAKAQAEQAQRSYEQARHVVEQRRGELDLAIKELQRDETLLTKGFATQQKVDQERTSKVTAEAALNAAMSAVAAYEAAIRVANGEVDRLTRQVADGTLVAPRSGRVLYRLAEPGEVLSAGGKVLTLLDLSDVYMTVFLPASLAGQLAVGADARLLLEPIPTIAIPANVSFISARAQFTPKQVETQSERDRMMFRAKVRIPQTLVQRYIEQTKTGVTGVAYVRLDPKVPWPAWLESDFTQAKAP
ncbi:HlyD family efflux transporter periplasmic adaptor subunit [Azorhizobium sp. AG788]|uniref:HlyD family secretion protein n=1 Tax=Azorhizobium sp. AG788 TaxID=2183897 RepID=UPI003138BBF2